MVPSLSIVLPVHNAEATLAENVCRLLEMLPDLAERFEVLVVDDGSTDHTAELAQELAVRFPQVSVVRHARRRGMATAIQTGIEHTRGEFILVQDERQTISPRDVRKLWQMRHDDDLVVARTEPQTKPIDAGLLSRLMNWGRGVQEVAGDRPLASAAQLIRRSAVRELESNPLRQKELRLSKVHGAEKIARVAARRHGTGVVTQLRDFALGE